MVDNVVADEGEVFSSTRLRVARQRMGWTLTKLAEESGVSLRSLTNYENAKYSPPADAISNLAAAMNVPVSFFARESIDGIPAESVSFRKLSRTSAGKRDAVLASASLALEFAGWIDEHFRLPVPSVPTLDKLAPELSAEVLRKRWELPLRPIPNLLHLLESKGVRVFSISSNYREVDAFSFIRDAVPFVFLNTTKSGERQRFDAAHELGHLVMHSESDLDLAESKIRENQANRFAASFLMPREGVLAQAMQNAPIDRILAAKTYWGVSAMAMTHRLHELRLLSDWTYRSTCAFLAERGYRSTEPDGMIPETSQVLKKVLFGKSTRSTLLQTARDLDISPSELRSYFTGLVPTAA